MDFRQKYFDIWQDVWNMHKKYAFLEQTQDDKWNSLFKDIEFLSNKYKEKDTTTFVNALILAVTSEIERLSKSN